MSLIRYTIQFHLFNNELCKIHVQDTLHVLMDLRHENEERFSMKNGAVLLRDHFVTSRTHTTHSLQS